MAATIKHLTDGGILFQGSEKMSGKESIAMNAQLYANDDAIRSIRYQIVDLLKVTSFDFTGDQMKTLAIQDNHAFTINPDMFIAIVLNDKLTHGMNRIYVSYLQQAEGSENVKIFSTIEEAEKWICGRIKT